MAKIFVKSPLYKRGLAVNWNRKVASPELNTEEDGAEWSFLRAKGLYGKYGHSVDLKNCSFSDLLLSLHVASGPENCKVDKEGFRQLALERESESEFPRNAVS